MPLTEYKVTPEEQTQQGVVAEVGNKLNGTVAQNKAVFDRLCNFLIAKYNQVLDLIYTKEETIQQINAKVAQIGAGDMAQADYDPTMQKKDIFAEIGKKATADESGSALSAVKLKVPRNINGVAFNGESNIVVACNENLLDNPWFTINQMGTSGAFSSAGQYFVDRWKLVTGMVTVNTDKTIVLNGTIEQVRENSLEKAFTASAVCTNGTASASYNDTNKKFTVTSSGGTLKMAKLEEGTVSTAERETRPDEGKQLALCQRYYLPIANYARQRATLVISNIIHFSIPTPVTMRATPTITGTPVVQKLDNAPQTGFVFSVGTKAANCITIIATKDAHGLTDATLNPNDIAFSAEL